LSISTAWAQVEEWLALPTVWIPQPTEQHAEILGNLLCASGTGGNLVSDAHLAALSIHKAIQSDYRQQSPAIVCQTL